MAEPRPPTLTLLPYQQRGVDLLVSRGGVGGIFMEMGTGKTRTALAVVRELVPDPVIVVVCPLSAVGVWGKECEKVWPAMRVVEATYGTMAKRTKQVVRSDAPFITPELFVVGYESYWRSPLRNAIIKLKPDAIIYDEAHRLKSARAKQAQFAHMLSSRIDIRMGLTGTPMPNGPQDLYSMYKGIDPTVFGTRKADFDRRYVIFGGFMGYQITGYDNQDEMTRKIQESSYRITKDEALDLPDQVDVEIPVTLDKRTRGVYEKLRKEAVVQVANAAGQTGVILSRTVLTNVLRLQQITSGIAKLEKEDEVIEFSSEKLDILKDLLDDVVPSAKRVVIFARFRKDIERIARICERKWHAWQLHGDIPPEERRAALDRFPETEGVVLIAQVAVASLGIDLSSAHVAIFYSPDYSLSNYLQSRDRLHRIGQEHKVTYYHLVATQTIDEKVYAALAKKERLSVDFLDAKRAKWLFDTN